MGLREYTATRGHVVYRRFSSRKLLYLVLALRPRKAPIVLAWVSSQAGLEYQQARGARLGFLTQAVEAVKVPLKRRV